MFAALAWDHHVGRPMISWIVVECAALGRKCGGWQALPPRHDVAYFVRDTAQRDAQGFAEFKNRQADDALLSADHDLLSASQRENVIGWHAAYPWDHQWMTPLLKWGVLTWSGDEAFSQPREDVAYFVDETSAEADARWFAHWRQDQELAIQEAFTKA